MSSAPLPKRALSLAGYLSLVTGGFSDNVRGPLLPGLVATFSASDARASLLLGLGSLSGVPGSLLAGFLIARYGPRAALRWSCVGLAAGLLLIAGAGLAGVFALVPVGAVLLGLGIAGLGIGANYFVAVASEPAERARALSRLHILYAAASITVPLVVVESFARFGWPPVVIATALAPLGLLLLSLGVPAVAPAASDSAPGPGTGDSSRGTVGVYAALISLFVVAEVAVSSWFLLLAERCSTWDRGERAALLVAFFLGMGVSRAVAGARLETAHLRRTIAAAGFLTAALVLAGLHVDAAFLALVGAAVGPIYPAAMTALTLELPAGRHGPAMGVVGAAYSLSLAVAHTAIGLASDRFGIAAALHLSPVCALAGLVVLLAGTRRRG